MADDPILVLRAAAGLAVSPMNWLILALALTARLAR